MNADTLAAAVTAKLAALGDGPDQVAESLRQADIHGLRSSVIACPIACYLKAQEDLWPAEVYVGASAITVITRGFIVAQDVAPPPAVGWFIAEFDRGRFPDLANGDNRTWQNLIEGTEGGGR
jgi:hypothetical protein